MHRLLVQRQLSLTAHLTRRGKLPDQYGYLNRENAGEHDQPYKREPLTDYTPTAQMMSDFGALRTAMYGGDVGKMMTQRLGTSPQAPGNRGAVVDAVRDPLGFLMTKNQSPTSLYHLDDNVLLTLRYSSYLANNADYEASCVEAIKEYQDKLIQPIIQRTAEHKLMLKGKAKLKEWGALKTGKLANITGTLDMNEWGIYHAAHKMMETRHWGLHNHEKSSAALDAFVTGDFAKGVRNECMNRTVRWNLEAVYPEETQIVGAQVYKLSLLIFN